MKELRDRKRDATPLVAAEATKYRGICARLNYLALDRADIAYAAKECARHMAQPCVGDWALLKHLGLYLLHHPRVILHYHWQANPETLAGVSSKRFGLEQVLGYTDSDWAGCPQTRKSTSGGAVMAGTHLLKTWSRTQATIALSSAEAELYATIRAAAEVLGLQSMMKDWGVKSHGSLLGDASACLALIKRQGLGRMRHLHTNYLWLQEKSAKEELMFGKVLGTENPSDLLTKYLGGELATKHMTALYCEFRGGRAESAPRTCG